MTRQQILDRVNRWRREHDLPPIPMRQYSRAVAIARQHQLISEEYLEWARLGFLPTPAQRKGVSA